MTRELTDWMTEDDAATLLRSLVTAGRNGMPLAPIVMEAMRHASVDASPSETTGGEVVGPLRKRWLADVEMLHLFAKHLDGQTIIGGTATVYDLGRCLRGIASTLTNRVTLETDPRSDHFIEVLTEVMGELRIVRDSSKGSLAQQVAHELRLRSAPPAGDGDTAKAEERARWEPQVTEAIEHLWGGNVPVCGSTLMQAVEHALGAPAGDGVPREDAALLEELVHLAWARGMLTSDTYKRCLNAAALSYCATRQPTNGEGR